MAQAQMQSDPLQRILSNIRELGLNDNLVELETIGYTTIKAVLSEEQIERAQEAILSRVESTSGRKVDIDRGQGKPSEG